MADGPNLCTRVLQLLYYRASDFVPTSAWEEGALNVIVIRLDTLRWDSLVEAVVGGAS